MMQDVIYDVNVSIDGFIAGSGGDISMFPAQGPMIDAYLDRLAEYRVAIMGRATYEFGYRFGLKPGANPYPHTRTIVFSRTLDLPSRAEIEVVRQDAVQSVARLREGDAGPIYLCGGGAFAASLLEADLIDRLRLKRSPVLVGGGTRLFAAETRPRSLDLLAEFSFPDGAIFQEYRVTEHAACAYEAVQDAAPIKEIES